MWVCALAHARRFPPGGRGGGRVDTHVLRELMSPTSAMSSSSANLMASAMLYVGCAGTATVGASLHASDTFMGALIVPADAEAVVVVVARV